MKPCYEGLKEIGVDVDEIYEGKGCYSLFWLETLLE